MDRSEILVMNGLTLCQKVKLVRTAKQLRQIDLASKAGVSVNDIGNLEKDRILILRPFKIKAVLRVLDLLEADDVEV